jgi:hypothetical protein
MKPVLKLWYSSTGKLRLLKEWVECPPEKLSIYADLASYSSWERKIARIKSESLPIMNAAEVKTHIFGVLTYDSFHDLPSAAWEERKVLSVKKDEYHGGDIGNTYTSAFIHLPKAENSAHGYTEGSEYPYRDVVRKAIFECQSNSHVVSVHDANRKVKELDAANKRIAELEAWKRQELELTQPIIGYCQNDENAKRLGIAIGSSIFKRVLEILKEYNQ